MTFTRSHPTLSGALIGLAVLWLLRQWVCMPVYISGNSMQPSLKPGQLAWINKLAYRFSPPRRGDVVAIWTGQDLILKRIVGLPGEEVSIRHGRFYVQGVPLSEPYVQIHGAPEITAGRPGADCFVVAGDNRAETLVAVVRRSRIIGRLVNTAKTFRGDRSSIGQIRKTSALILSPNTPKTIAVGKTQSSQGTHPGSHHRDEFHLYPLRCGQGLSLCHRCVDASSPR
jgi:signal peptidase I